MTNGQRLKWLGPALMEFGFVVKETVNVSFITRKQAV